MPEPRVITVTDMTGREVQIRTPVSRVISLVPSQTEFLYDLGMGDRIVGQTVFCVHPRDRYRDAVKVGGTKKIRYDAVDELAPDLIICNKEENTREMVELLSEKYPVWVSDIRNTDDAFYMMRALGGILEAEGSAQDIISRISSGMDARKVYRQWPCVYMIWRNPWMAAGKNTFISHMLEKAGFTNVINADRYPALGEEELALLDPPLVLLSSEPYPFTDKHAEEIRKILPRARVLRVDGEMFSWYGSRLVNSQAYFNELQRSLHKTSR